MIRRGYALLVCLCLALTACTGDSPKPSPFGDCHPAGLLSVGDPLPDCTFRAWDGSPVRLADLKGKPAVLNFWASWCAECIKEMPAFEAVSKQVAGSVRIVGFNEVGVQGEVESEARKFAKARSVDYDLAFDERGLLYAAFSVKTLLPTTIFVGADGLVKHRRFGPLETKQLRDLIREHLKA